MSEVRLIDANALKEDLKQYFTDGVLDGVSARVTFNQILLDIDNAPTVDTKELKPLVDKVVEILPELTDAIIKELPKIASGKIKCSDCSYYTNTFNGEWVRKEDILHYIATQYSEHNELVPIWLNIGNLKGGES